MANHEGSEHVHLISDVKRALNRVNRATFIEAKKETANEIYPLLLTIVEHFGERMDRAETAIDTIINNVGSVLQMPEAEQLAATFELGRKLGTSVLALEAGMVLDEITVRRLKEEASTFLAAATGAIEMIDQVTIEDDEDEDDEDEDGEDKDEEDVAEPDTAESSEE